MWNLIFCLGNSPSSPGYLPDAQGAQLDLAQTTGRRGHPISSTMGPGARVLKSHPPRFSESVPSTVLHFVQNTEPCKRWAISLTYVGTPAPFGAALRSVATTLPELNSRRAGYIVSALFVLPCARKFPAKWVVPQVTIVLIWS